MKKAIAVLLVTAMTALMLCSCKIGKCDLCGESGILNERSFLGTDFYLCSDCGG